MRRAYIAAPFWHPSPAVREWNTRRAELLCRLAAAEGWEPVSVHRELMDAEVDDDADPKARARGLERTCATVREIKAEGGAMYVLCRAYMVYSDGVRLEMDTWDNTPHVHANRMIIADWPALRGFAERAGLLAEWVALAAPPC